jgi:hypothetical protein
VEKMANVTLNALYEQVLYLRKELRTLERMLVPEMELSKKELGRLKKMRQEAKKELKEGRLVRLEDI